MLNMKYNELIDCDNEKLFKTEILYWRCVAQWLILEHSSVIV